MTARALAAVLSTPTRRQVAAAAAIWTVVAVAILLVEAHALQTDEVYATLSAYLRAIRFSPVGRFVVLPFGCWLFVHICIAPRWLGVNPLNWRLWLGLAIGLAWATCEQFDVLGMRR